MHAAFVKTLARYRLALVDTQVIATIEQLLTAKWHERVLHGNLAFFH